MEEVETNLQTSLGRSFEVEPQAITLGNSASSLVRNYIVAQSKERVAVPHYSCQSLVDAIIDAEAMPIFYDIEDDTTVADRAVQFAINANCDTFIWPTYFGNSKRDSSLQDTLHDNDAAIVFDEAQANPFSRPVQQTRAHLHGDDVAVYSFGVSKLLAGSGGGAMYGSNGRDLLTESQLPYQETNTGILPRFETQLELLEARQHQGSSESRISRFNASTALQQIEGYISLRAEHDERYKLVSVAITENLGETALRYLQYIDGAPTILAVNVPNAQRYEIMNSLSQEGVQSTWYYHPIHRVSRYRQYPAQEDEGAAGVANSVVVLPFQWTHTSEQVDRLIYAIQKIGTI